LTEIIKNTDLAVGAFLEGKIGVFPTDTVWGVGCVLRNEKAIKRLYKIKRRDFKKPTAVLVASLKQAKKLGRFDKEAEELARKYWPGGLTLIVAISPPGWKIFSPRRRFPSKIGLRIPNNKRLLKILGKTGPIMATSANFAGEHAPTKKNQISKKFLKEVDFLVEGEEPKQAQASTVLDTTVKPFKILRQGSVIL